jgi:5'-3' exonuclease
MKKLLLVDGNYYAYRSFFAIRGLSNSRGEPTNAIFGFAKTIRRMIKDLQPDLGAVCWDSGLPARRTELQPAYKQHRAEMPAEMVSQMPFIRDLAPMLGLQNAVLPDTEADDLMASYCCAAYHHKIEVVLATNDKDLLSLADETISVYSTAKADLIPPEEFTLLGPESITKKWGVAPARILDVLALSGDASDNITGVAGVGPKTATTLIQNAGTLDKLLADLDAVKNEKLRAKLAAAREQILQNREMVRLDTDLPLPAPLDSLAIAPKYDQLIKAIERCEFRSMLSEIKAEAKRGGPSGGDVATPKETQDDLFPF